MHPQERDFDFENRVGVGCMSLLSHGVVFCSFYRVATLPTDTSVQGPLSR